MSKQPHSDIDLALEVIMVVSPPNYEWSLADIADVCGCSRQNIQKIYHSGMQKLKGYEHLREHIALRDTKDTNNQTKKEEDLCVLKQ